MGVTTSQEVPAPRTQVFHEQLVAEVPEQRMFAQLQRYHLIFLDCYLRMLMCFEALSSEKKFVMPIVGSISF